ncbi:MAG: hypothetical protein AAGI24_14500 [Pseudomonadota bacterium]
MLFAIAFAPMLISCGSGGGSGSDDPALPDPQVQLPASNIPRLSEGKHLGLTVGFDPLSLQQQQQTEALLEINVAAGSTISRAQLDWAELESAPGVYDLAVLMAALDEATRFGQQPFLTLSTVDTGGLALPSDLQTEQGALVDGMSLDAPSILARLESFLGWLVPELAAYEVWGLAIANESSTVFETIDRLEITRFLQAGISAVKRLDDNLAVTVTFVGDTQPGSMVERFLADLLPSLDLVSFNYYCLSNELVTTNQARWQSDIEILAARAGGKPIFFQELGCPAGWSDTRSAEQDRAATINAAPALQSEFFRLMLGQVEENAEIRAATVFQLYDWSPELVLSFVEPFRAPDEPGNELVIDRLSEWLGSVGMCRWSDGSCREAWDIYLEGLARLAEGR